MNKSKFFILFSFLLFQQTKAVKPEDALERASRIIKSGRIQVTAFFDCIRALSVLEDNQSFSNPTQLIRIITLLSNSISLLPYSTEVQYSKHAAILCDTLTSNAINNHLLMFAAQYDTTLSQRTNFLYDKHIDTGLLLDLIVEFVRNNNLISKVIHDVEIFTLTHMLLRPMNNSISVATSSLQALAFIIKSLTKEEYKEDLIEKFNKMLEVYNNLKSSLIFDLDKDNFLSCIQISPTLFFPSTTVSVPAEAAAASA